MADDMPRFSDAELERFFLDPRQPCTWAICPFCGGTMVMGYRKDRAAGASLVLAHTAVRHADGAATACEKWDAHQGPLIGAFVKLLRAASVRFRPLVG